MSTTARGREQPPIAPASDSDLPEGWTAATMGEVANVVGGGTPSTSDPTNFSDRGHPWITPADLSGFEGVWIRRGKRGLTDKGLRTSSATPMPKGTVLMSSRAPIGYVAIAANPLTTNQGFKSFILGPGIMPEFCFYWLKFLGPYLREMGSGSTFLEISGSRARDIPFFIGPAAEQQRIVAKIEELLPQVNAIRARLVRGAQVLKRFRQAVLAAACSGRLTQDFHRDGVDSEDLPSDWHRATVDDLLIRNGIFDGPFGSNLKTSDYTESGVRVIRMENVGWLKFIGSKQTFISEKKYESLTRHTVGSGDIIFSSFIGDEIRSCVLPAFPTKAIAKADCFCLRPDARHVDRGYLALQLSSQESYDALREHIHGATRPRVNTTQVRELSVRVCPMPEQKEIVRRVEALFAHTDAIEKQVVAATKRAEKLPQAILAKAFRGDLVPIEAELARREGRDYEPASALLEHIKAERNASLAHPAGRKPHVTSRRAGKARERGNR